MVWGVREKEDKKGGGVGTAGGGRGGMGGAPSRKTPILDSWPRRDENSEKMKGIK